MDIPLFRLWLQETKALSDSSVYAYTVCAGAFLKRNPDLENLQDYNDFLIKVTIKQRASYYYSAIRHFINFKISDNSIKKKILFGIIILIVLSFLYLFIMYPFFNIAVMEFFAKLI